MSKQKCEWFLEPQDAQSNQIIAQEISEENFCRSVLCQDGEKRNLWLVPFSLVKFFWKSKSCGIDIKIFNRAINSGTSRGKVKDVTFLLKKRKKQPQR